jgi:putative ABC transport system permease protein
MLVTLAEERLQLKLSEVMMLLPLAEEKLQ